MCAAFLSSGKSLAVFSYLFFVFVVSSTELFFLQITHVVSLMKYLNVLLSWRLFLFC